MNNKFDAALATALNRFFKEKKSIAHLTISLCASANAYPQDIITMTEFRNYIEANRN